MCMRGFMLFVFFAVLVRDLYCFFWSHYAVRFISSCVSVFFFNVTATTEIYTYGHTLSLHDAPPICLPAVAVSLVTADHDGRHYDTAARAAVEIGARLAADPLPADTILNVNVPDLPWEEVAGFEVARLGNRHRAEPCIQQHDPRGRDWWWIGPAGAEHDSGAGTDFHAVRTGHISITPIHVDLTRYQALEQVASWVDGLAQGLREDAA